MAINLAIHPVVNYGPLPAFWGARAPRIKLDKYNSLAFLFLRVLTSKVSVTFGLKTKQALSFGALRFSCFQMLTFAAVSICGRSVFHHLAAQISFPIPPHRAGCLYICSSSAPGRAPAPGAAARLRGGAVTVNTGGVLAIFEVLKRFGARHRAQ